MMQFLLALIFSATEIHVGPQEAIPESGHVQQTVRSLQAAWDLAGPGDTIVVHGGTYSLEETLTVSAAKSGSAESPTVMRAAEGDTVRISGGRVLPADGFAPPSSPDVVARLDQGAKEAIVALDLTAAGLANFGSFPDQFSNPPTVMELFVNDTRMTLARWPNEGWTEVAEVIESGPAPWRKHESDKLGVFAYSGERPDRWANADKVWLEGYWCFDWRSEYILVGDIDTATKQITLAKQHVYGLGSGNPGGRRFYAVNLLEELDAPGEYYIDRDVGMLYFYPIAPLAESRVVVSEMAEPLLRLDGAKHVRIEGLIFEACQGTAVQVVDGSDVVLAGCTVRNTGQSGIDINGGERHRVQSCDLYDIGTAALAMDGGDRKTLTPAGHVAENNDIYRFARRQRTYAPAIHLGGVGNRLAHNRLHDAPHSAIIMGGNDHVVEYNEVFDVIAETDDCGALYTGRNPSMRGSVIRYNYFHDLGAREGHGNNAVYFDDGDGGQTVYGNVFYRCGNPGKGGMGSVFNHGGHGNMVENNVFIECKRAVGAAPWNDGHWKEWVEGDLWHTRLREEVDITQPPYTTKYPELVGFFELKGEPRMNHAVRNVMVNCGEFMSGNYEVQENWETESDPGFIDMTGKNYGLREDAAVFSEIPGFEPIPFEEIGLYADAWRERVEK